MRFRAKINDQVSGGKLYGYTLLATRNGYQWSGMLINNADQMRQLAKVLLKKADEIDEAGDTDVHSSPSS